MMDLHRHNLISLIWNSSDFNRVLGTLELPPDIIMYLKRYIAKDAKEKLIAKAINNLQNETILRIDKEIEALIIKEILPNLKDQTNESK